MHTFPANRLGCLNILSGLIAALAIGSAAPGAVPAYSPYQPSPDQRIENRPAELWQYYMHGVVDYFAQPIDLPGLLDQPGLRKKWIVSDRPIDTPYFKSNQPALKVDAKQSLMLPVPLPVDLDKARGKTIRVFVWVSGENVGRKDSPNSYPEPPNMVLIANDNSGRMLAVTNSMTGSTGTFPWHCYHKDFFVPEQTASIGVKFINSYGGSAWFSNVSWELAAPDYSNNDRQDPTTGSWASNPWHDQMSQHFRFIQGYDVTRYKWRFFEGPAVGMVEQAYNMSTPEGLRQYFQEKVLTDNDHMNHSLMYFGSRYHFGRQHNLLPASMDERWLAELTRLVIDHQDKNTGYWGTRHDPASMGITFHFLDGLFGYYGFRRVNPSEEFRNEERHLAVLEIPRADLIIKTTLAMQTSYKNEQGQEVLAAWPHSAYNFTDKPNANGPQVDQSVTHNAIDLLRRCERFVDQPLQQRVYTSIRSAIAYVLTRSLNEDGAWNQATDLAGSATDIFYMPGIISDSHYLERVPMPELAPPQIVAKRTAAGELTLSWTSPEGNQNSVRIFIAADGVPFEKAGLPDLAGIIHRTGHQFIEKDPFIVIRQMEKASRQHWGKGWPDNTYVQQKTLELPKNLPFTDDAQALTLKANNLAGKKIYAVAATWYGEESKPVVVHVVKY